MQATTQMPAPPVVVPPHVDHVLEQIGRELQITPTQFARAVSSYRDVGDWLQRPESELSAYGTDVYPQGSIALRTTVRPLTGEEFDLDLVCEVERWHGSSMDLHAALGRRLGQHERYAKILEPMNRCWRLNYETSFHLDALPARSDVTRPGNAIEVPDRDARSWKASNPRDYIAWFDARAGNYYRVIQERALAPVPAPDPFDAADPLRRAIQLMKRHRDVRFEGKEKNAPRSIILTTLAARGYSGTTSLTHTLLTALGMMRAEIAAAAPGILEVRNPVNADENFGDAWVGNRQAYVEFTEYVTRFETDLLGLITAPYGEEFRGRAARLFGVSVTERAMHLYNEKHGREALAALTHIGQGANEAARPWRA